MNKKKIGILSQYYRRNYGGILQSYALFRTVQELGYDVEIIDFRYNAKDNLSLYQLLDILANKLFGQHKGKKEIVKKIRSLPKEHVEAFMKFKEKYQVLSPALTNNTIGEYASKYDAIIVGSDQVWNDLKGKHLFYFFDFGKPYNGGKITYAPCSHITSINGITKRRLNKLFHNIDSFSVRDVTTKELVTLASGITPKIVLDPTYLYDFTEFVNNPIVEGNYIFTYILGSEIACGHKTVMEKIFERYGKMKIVAAIIPDDSLEVEKFADEIKYNASPDEWVNLIANAKFVYTDSFHGCVFSMKFHKQFFAYYKDKERASRLIDLRSTYSINNIKASGEDVLLDNIDYDKVDKIIEDKKSYSMKFLKNSLPE